MNEIDVVVDVRQSPDTAELIVLKQKVAFSGESSLVGGPVETRVGLLTRTSQTKNGSEEGAHTGAVHSDPAPDQTGIVLHRRAMPFFDTLAESDRLAVIKAVAPLRGMEIDQWPSAGAQPIEGTPFTFVVRAGDDLGVIVSRTDDKRVEIADIVRLSALDQFDTSGEGLKQ
jgi:hypothetical protein